MLSVSILDSYSILQCMLTLFPVVVVYPSLIHILNLYDYHVSPDLPWAILHVTVLHNPKIVIFFCLLGTLIVTYRSEHHESIEPPFLDFEDQE